MVLLLCQSFAGVVSSTIIGFEKPLALIAFFFSRFSFHFYFQTSSAKNALFGLS
jgi:hypothetical protein